MGILKKKNDEIRDDFGSNPKKQFIINNNHNETKTVQMLVSEPKYYFSKRKKGLSKKELHKLHVAIKKQQRDDKDGLPEPINYNNLNEAKEEKHLNHSDVEKTLDIVVDNSKDSRDDKQKKLHKKSSKELNNSKDVKSSETLDVSIGKETHKEILKPKHDKEETHKYLDETISDLEEDNFIDEVWTNPEIKGVANEKKNWDLNKIPSFHKIITEEEKKDSSKHKKTTTKKK